MSTEETDQLKSMVLHFRVSELQMLLGFAGRNKSGRKKELQQRALELLRVRSHPVHLKIRELYKSIQLQNAGVPNQSGVVGQGGKDHQTLPNLSQAIQQHNPQNIPRATVHPYNHQTSTDNRQLQPPRSAQMYNQQTLYQYATQQYPSAKPALANNYPVHPDVRFKRLPFFDVLSDLIKPSTLVPQSQQRMQDQSFYFHLTPAQASDIASNRDLRPDSKLEYVKQVQLRFCLLETSCDQEDYFPPQIQVKVNNKLCPLPNPIPTNKPNTEAKRPPRPVNITPLIKLNPTVANTISVTWAAEYGRGYVMSVMLVQKLNSSELLQRLKSRGNKHSDYTRGLIKEKLSEDADCEIATTSLRVSLKCPLGKMLMSTPCRSTTCQHLQCFDASLFLQMNERKPTWNCPVCDKPAFYDHLVIDGYFQEVLASPNLPSDTSEIQLHQDGSWSTHVAVKKEVAKTAEPLDESVQIIDDDCIISVIGDDEKSKAASVPAKNASVVDLTVSDSEDEAPPKRKTPPKPDSTNTFNDTTSVSSTASCVQLSTTSGSSSVSSSGYQSPSVITLDSPSPPNSPSVQRQRSSCMMTATPPMISYPQAQNNNQITDNSMFNIGTLPFLDLDDYQAFH